MSDLVLVVRLSDRAMKHDIAEEPAHSDRMKPTDMSPMRPRPSTLSTVGGDQVVDDGLGEGALREFDDAVVDDVDGAGGANQPAT